MRFAKIPSISRSFPLRVFAFLFIIGIFLIPRPADAAFIAEAVGVLAAALTGLLALIMNIEGALINWLIDPDIWGEAFTKNPTIILGWRVMRDFANLGFVLAIIVIAIGFILRIQTYGSQKTLTRLIVAAVLVNFSLVIAGVFIDAATIVSRFLLDGFGVTDIWGSLLRASGALDLVTPSEANPLWSRALGFLVRTVWLPADLAAAGQIIIKTLVTAIFSIMMIATLGALIVMLLMRIAHLWVLLVLAPMAWLLWIFPQFESNWKKWWTEFLRWTFFAPIVIFFLAFSLTIIGNTGKLPRNDPRNFLEAAVQVFGQVFRGIISEESPTQTFARFTIAIAVLVLSMVMASNMGISFADQGVKWATAAGKWPGLTTWRAGLRQGRQQFATSALGQRLKTRFSGVPILGGVSRKIQALEQETEGDMKKARAELEAIKKDPQRLARIAARDMRKPYRVAATQILSEEDPRLLPALLTDSEIQARLNEAHSISPEMEEKIFASNPPALLAAHNRIPGIRGIDPDKMFKKVADEQADRIFTPDVLRIVEGNLALFRDISTKALQNILEKGNSAQKEGLARIYARFSEAAATGGAAEQAALDRAIRKLNPDQAYMALSESMLRGLSAAARDQLIVKIPIPILVGIHESGEASQNQLIAERLQDIYTDPHASADMKTEAMRRIFNPRLSAYKP